MFSAAATRVGFPSLLTLLAALLLTGCPSSVPNQPAVNPSANNSGPTDKNTAAQDDPAAVKGLEEAGATLKKDSGGNVSEVTLARGDNDDLKHLAGLPHVTVLSAEVRGITGAGLAHLKGHPSLKILRLEQSDIANDDAKYLLDIPKLDDLDLKRTDLAALAYGTPAQRK